MRKKKSQKKKRMQEDYPVNVKPKDAKPPDPKKISKAEKLTADLTWDQLDTVDDIVENMCLSRRNSSLNGEQETPKENVYPEIVWYLLSRYIVPEEIGRFAGINRATYAITHRESFWRSIYYKYCKTDPCLPASLKIENNYQSYGLRQRVVRALYHTYGVFISKAELNGKDTRLYDLTQKRCINMWFEKKTPFTWSVYFKFKKFLLRNHTRRQNFIKELGRMDANPEEDLQVLKVTCRHFHEVPPLMGMILSKVTIIHSVSAIEHRLHLGFNTGTYAVGKNILPECNVVLDTVISFSVYDWWHPKYPHPESKVTVTMEDDEVVPILKDDFFSAREGELF